jgi:hypothetical protein
LWQASKIEITVDFIYAVPAFSFVGQSDFREGKNMLFTGLGSVLLLAGAIWLIVIAVQTGKSTGEKVVWALVNFFCQPLGGIVFYFMTKQGLIPLILVIIGSILTGIGYSSMMGEMMKNMPK